MHPPFYTTLLHRRLAGDLTLTPEERQELDLHLLVCPQCNYDAAQLLQPRYSGAAAQLRQRLTAVLTVELVLPYLPDLAQAIRAGRPLTGFQELVWDFVAHNPVALGYLGLLEAAGPLADQ